jgi:regulator of protease activity HflC (stomatin/prohibitin superfamily)
MKKFLKIGLLLSMLVFGVACSKVTAGNVGIKVNLLGAEKGVSQEVLGPGRYWLGMNEELYVFPTFQQNYTWTASLTEGNSTDESLTFQTKEGMVVNVDIGISYSVDSEKVATLFQKYRKGVDELTDVVLRNAVRDSLNEFGATLSVEEVYSTKKAELMAKVQEKVATEFKPIGINIENLFLIGSMRLPTNVIAALNSKIEATQKAQQRENELRESEAEAKKVVAQAEGESKATLLRAEAEAKANKLKLATLTRELIQYEAIQRWDGKLPQVNGSGTMPMINLKSIGEESK